MIQTAHLLSISVSGEPTRLVGAVLDPTELETLQGNMPSGGYLQEAQIVQGLDERLYCVVGGKLTAVPEYRAADEVAKQARRDAALAKLSPEDKEALGLIFDEAREK